MINADSTTIRSTIDINLVSDLLGEFLFFLFVFSKKYIEGRGVLNCAFWVFLRGPKLRFSTVSKEERKKCTFLGKLCDHRPILGSHSWTAPLYDTSKWVFCDGTDTHNYGYTDIATL